MDVDRESSVPSIYSVQLLFFSSLLLAIISILKHKEKDRYRWHWTILSAGFLVMTFDEGASIHELIVTPFHNLLGDVLPKFLVFNWIVIGVLVVCIVVAFYIKFFLALPKRTKILLFLSAFIYLGGALGMEMVGSVYASQFGIKNLPYNTLTTIEETLEMLGLVLTIYTFLDYLKKNYGSIDLRL